MDRVRIAQIYGYLVCLIAVVTFLISLNSAVGAAIDLADPVYSASYRGDSRLASFEVYRVEMAQRRAMPGMAGAPEAALPDSAQLRAAYEAARENQIRSVRFRAIRQAVTGGLLVLVSAGLFVAHWAWLRRLGARE
ncbi:MAG TPA: hypothetical protein VF192_01745 [Longimicrobiales bacterium]